eukprot:c2675_g1_i1.p1 GENE.c2675_g1_i1~~c2675_g1_i1.p1  ORF type:complete len:281 (+),score=41.22 c2675_g1_i1:86-928(+)
MLFCAYSFRPQKPTTLTLANVPPYAPPPWCTNELDRKGLLELRLMCEFDKIPDEELVRFLRSRKHNMRKTLALLTSHVRFLEKYRPNLILLSMLKNPMRTGCWRVLGRDRQGRPVIWARASLYNLDECTQEEFLLMVLWFFDQTARMCSAHENGEPCQITWLFDFGDFNGSYATLNSHSSASIEAVQNHFPGLISNIRVIRANWIFHKAFKALKGFMDEGFANMIEFVNNSDVTESLLSWIDPAVLPRMYGGQADVPPCPNIPNIPNITVEPMRGSKSAS